MIYSDLNARSDKCRLSSPYTSPQKIGCSPMTFIVSSVWGFDFLVLFLFLKQEYHMHQSHPLPQRSFYECWYAQWRLHQWPWIQRRCIICCRQRKNLLSKQCSSCLLFFFSLPSLFQTHLVSSLFSCFLFIAVMGTAVMWVVLLERIKQP